LEAATIESYRQAELAKSTKRTAVVKAPSASRSQRVVSQSTPTKRKGSNSSSSLSGDTPSDSSNSPPAVEQKKPLANTSKPEEQEHKTLYIQNKEQVQKGFSAMRIALARFLDPALPTFDRNQVDSTSLAPYRRPGSIRTFLQAFVLKVALSQVLAFVLFVLFMWNLLKRKGRRRMTEILNKMWNKVMSTVRLGTKMV